MQAVTRPLTRPGRLSQRMVWERPVTAPDGLGGESLDYLPIGHVWADLRPGTARDVALGEGRVGEVTHEIFVRREVGLLAGDRLRLGARLFLCVICHDPDASGRFTRAEAVEEV
ncbi:head-tail adaptor protein [Afifella sp. H1R]|uniref:head-tail adaptor protein n=1 Tax=Afifella sp. H1R TaxID=2908841 RepID=UPI001F178F4B|nr:head-tail adaptor protein [Afifella sp. H1R]MCF1505653.1 head-tail adaptor protein [Afifella sp. H1R]